MATTFVYQSRSEDAWDARANQAPNIEDMTVIQQGKQYVLGCWDEGLILLTDKRFRKPHRAQQFLKKELEKMREAQDRKAIRNMCFWRMDTMIYGGYSIPYRYIKLFPEKFTWLKELSDLSLASDKKIVTLSYADAGRAMRILLNIWGRPLKHYTEFPYIQPLGGGHIPVEKFNQWRQKNPLNCRRVLWNVSSRDKASRTEQAIRQLLSAGITDFKLTRFGWFFIHIPTDCHVSSYYTSDDPAVWERKNQQRERQRKIREVELTLDGKRWRRR
jgi:hypothetical protein